MSSSNSASRTSSSPDERDALALALVENVGAVEWRRQVAAFGSATNALDATFAGDAARARADADARLADASRSIGARMLLEGGASYPARLLDLARPPVIVWLAGDASLLDIPTVAIVGTRNATAYGERVARSIASAVARAGGCVVSGMARGIDAAAHRGALDAGGATVAVLGTGIDIAYPRQHARLHREIAEKGLLVSELHPGDRAHGGSFPERNRIIAALARVIIVVEAPFKSGALRTADHAMELDRPLGIVPGPIDLPHCAGSNRYMRDGAIVIADVADVLQLAGLTPAVHAPTGASTPAERAVWDALGKGGRSLDDLCSLTGLPAGECLAAVTTLELSGAIDCGLTGEVTRR
ncbi:MAG: protecting protein DprA [Gemmatimonadetes bacterium]|nr:protecting protein DprA [Gemmatimonadota bacterium]